MFLLFLNISLASSLNPELSLEQFTRDVLAVNPEGAAAEATLARLRAEARAAGAWPDPMVDLSIAPLSLAGMPGLQVELRQDLPLWGERRSAVAMLDAEAEAAEASAEMMRLELAGMAAMAWFDWYTLHREISLIGATTATLDEVRIAVVARVATARATDLDVLQVDAERGWLAVQARTLDVERDIVALRINTLLHRDPGTPVPAPPVGLARPQTPAATGARPEGAEAAAMRRAAEAELRMARVERLPMLGAMVGWDAMQVMPEDRLMVGVSVQVPLDQRAKAATVEASAAALEGARAEEAKVRDLIAEDIARAERRFQGQSAALDVLERDVLPAIHARANATREGYAAGAVDLRQVLEAERAALDAEVRHEEALALLVLRAREVELARGITLLGEGL